MTDELAFNIKQLNQEGIKVLDFEDTIKSYTITLEKNWKIECIDDYWFILTRNEKIVTRTGKFSIILNALNNPKFINYKEVI